MADNNQDFIQVLLEKIEKDDLPTNVFDVEGTDPLVLLGKMNEIIGQLENFQSSVNTSNSTANEALSKAEDAVDTSGQALSNANTALGTANQAIGTANTVIETANQSLETAQEAKDIADSANQNSGQAVTTANEAKETAENALEQVTQGLGTKVYDNAGNLLNETTFTGENGVNVDMQEQNPNNFVISLDNTITNQIEQNKNNIAQLNNDVSELNQTANSALTTANSALTTANGAVSKNTEQDNSISALQTADGQNVKISGGQDIGGSKNFLIMPQVSSSPIISNGSNANGYYIKFADGTLICWGEWFTKQSTILSHTFVYPYPFISNTAYLSVSVTPVSVTSNGFSGSVNNLSSTSLDANYYGVTSRDVGVGLKYIAIGRWK